MMTQIHCKQSLRSNVSVVRQTAFFPCLLLACVGVFAGCANENSSRRSAVDVAKLCKDDPDAVFAGSCLQRSVNQDDLNRTPTTPTTPEQRPLPDDSRGIPPPADPNPKEPPKEEARGTPASELPREELPRPTESLPRANESQPLPGSRDNPPAAKNRVLTFTQQSFVALADKTVVMNCFVPAGTKVEFSGDLSEVTQFKTLGVLQKIVFKTVSVTYPAGTKEECNLSGRNFVFLAQHAVEEPVP